jgi:CDP-diacylglycerol--glycerol-3-phosphate 3-phosphatidyltransferase
MILVPVFVICMYLPVSWYNILALVVFIVASLTDTADGYIARKYNMITDFGKFMDPLADKLLVCSAMICLVGKDMLPAWVVIIIVAREFAISGFRLIAADNGLVIAASYWGKAKTISQDIMIIVLLLNIDGWEIFETVMVVIATALTIISLIDYFVKNKQVLASQK